MYEKSKWRVPILIPTCNRINHLKRCVDSLAKNKEAKETDIYISIDYPPSEKYFDGYNENLEYLKKLEKNDLKLFKNVYVFFQDNNLGPIKNSEFLHRQLSGKTDIFFFTEDDNVFSESVLEYVNNSLEKYRYEEQVVLVSTNNQCKRDKKRKSKTILHRYANIYGFASWYIKYDKMVKWINCDNMDEIANNNKKMLCLKRFNLGAFNLFYSGYIEKKEPPFFEDGQINPIDLYIGMYIFFNRKYVIFPSRNLSKNEGNDGTGLHTKKNDYTSIDISNKKEEYNLNDDCEKSNSSKKIYYKNIIDYLRSQKPFVKYCLKHTINNFK